MQCLAMAQSLVNAFVVVVEKKVLKVLVVKGIMHQRHRGRLKLSPNCNEKYGKGEGWPGEN